VSSGALVSWFFGGVGGWDEAINLSVKTRGQKNWCLPSSFTIDSSKFVIEAKTKTSTSKFLL